MKKDKDPIARLEAVLAQAYREQPTVLSPKQWRQAVMRDIRQLQGESKKPDGNVVFRRMILPFASAAAVAAIIITVYSFTFVPGFEQDLFSVITEDPSGLISTQILDI